LHGEHLENSHNPINHDFLPKTMHKSLIIYSCLLAITTAASAFAAPPHCDPKSLTFNCRSRGPNTTVAIKGNQTYSATTNSGAVEEGNYKVVGSAYRFISGGLKDQSIVQQKGGMYLVATASETKAAELAKSDGALVCTRQV
jgi:hypothetical protein